MEFDEFGLAFGGVGSLLADQSFQGAHTQVLGVLQPVAFVLGRGAR